MSGVECGEAGNRGTVTAMSSAPAPQFPYTSPCIKVCVIDAHGECHGCRRTLAEIGAWSSMSLEQRRLVNQRVGFRGHDERR